jgi:hypothetical protein
LSQRSNSGFSITSPSTLATAPAGTVLPQPVAARTARARPPGARRAYARERRKTVARVERTSRSMVTF